MSPQSIPLQKLCVVALMIAATAGLVDLFCSSLSLLPTFSVRKDFAQEYLMAKAVLYGTDPYLPLPELGGRFSYPDITKLFPHPSAHPPFMAVLSLPFAMVSYPVAAGAWFVLELLLITLACWLLAKWWSTPDRLLIHVMLTLSLFAWEPVFDELIFGQLNSLQLVLLTWSWLNLRQHRDVPGGVFLGLAITIKLLAWPIALYLLMTRRWLGFMATGATVITANLVAMLVIGPGSFWGYYNSTRAAILPFWRAHEANFSVWSIGWRLFDGAHGRGVEMNLIAPLYQSPILANVVSMSAAVIFLLSCIWVALKMTHFDFAFGILVCAAILLSPVTWNHYLLLPLIPLAVVCRTFVHEKLAFIRHRWVYLLSAITALAIIAPGQKTRELMELFETHQTVMPNGTIIHHVPFTIGLISLVPLVAVLCLMWLIWLLDGIVSKKTMDPDPQQVTQHL